ncbi:hypothetical protein Lsai_1194 [Legionella sainthelensi]|uniref:Uncharacterized protein n=1 Tax=Legionella sainthelensi TaxID=28087 RepID=A0A0W0YP19_9GAMM|nr:hypothetical protein [Legionella sainthelensi]KTD58587.1 hypothetical protein Lsai_1194 [Legionella sainthelensi]VEH34390.1 Uncharacterised protein [Legionella sainthelensi]
MIAIFYMVHYLNFIRSKEHTYQVNAYAGGGYLENADVYDAVHYDGEYVYVVLFHPNQMGAHADDVHHHNGYSYEFPLHEYVRGYDFQLNESLPQCPLKLQQSKEKMMWVREK